MLGFSRFQGSLTRHTHDSRSEDTHTGQSEITAVRSTARRVNRGAYDALLHNPPAPVTTKASVLNNVTSSGGTPHEPQTGVGAGTNIFHKCPLDWPLPPRRSAGARALHSTSPSGSASSTAPLATIAAAASRCACVSQIALRVISAASSTALRTNQSCQMTLITASSCPRVDLSPISQY